MGMNLIHILSLMREEPKMPEQRDMRFTSTCDKHCYFDGF